MVRTAALVALCAGAMMLAFTSSSALAKPTPGDCQNDSKLIGAIELSTDDRPGTWWFITSNGLDEAGFETDAEKLEITELIFGTDFATLADAVTALVDAIRPLDKNGNNFVCASTVRGTKGFLPDPSFTSFFFSVIDDKHVK
jgi:hypothetical protein